MDRSNAMSDAEDERMTAAMTLKEMKIYSCESGVRRAHET